MPKPSRMHTIRGTEASEIAMKNDPAGLDQIDQALVTYDLSDEALEAAAGVDGGRAITVGYCATAANAWYCMPF
jgi:dienelactone hydrolase